MAASQLENGDHGPSVEHHDHDNRSDAVEQKCAKTVQSIQRDLNRLSDSTTDRQTKRRTLEALNRNIFEPVVAERDPEYTAAVLKAISPCLAKLLGDSVEKCRDLSTQIIERMISQVADVRPFLSTIVPAICDRLSPEEIKEPSEEIRLALLNLTILLIEKCDADAYLIAKDAAAMLRQTLGDPFPDARKTSFQLIMHLTALCPQQFRLYAEKLLKRMMPSLAHRHAAVRTLAIQAVGAAVHVDPSTFRETWPAVKKLALDPHPTVRQQLYATMEDWQLHLTDRYSFADCMVGVLLQGRCDDVAELRVQCDTAIQRISKLYEDDWEDRIKDRLDYATGDQRELLGFRTLVRENTLKITDAIATDLADWTAPVREGAVKQLSEVLVFTEEHISGYLGKLVPALAKLVHEPFAPMVFQAAQRIGECVKPDLLLHLMLAHISTKSYLILFSESIKNAKLSEEHIASIAQEMQGLTSTNEFASTAEPELRHLYVHLLNAAAKLPQLNGALDRSVLLAVGVRLADDAVAAEMKHSPLDLFSLVLQTLATLAKQELVWQSAELYLLRRLIQVAPPERVLDVPLVGFLQKLGTDNDEPSVMSRVDLADALLEKVSAFSPEFAQAIWPLLVLWIKWRSGRKHAALRVPLSALLVGCAPLVKLDAVQSINPQQAPALAPGKPQFAIPPPGPLADLLAALVPCMDDDDMQERLNLLNVLDSFLQRDQWTPEHLKALYPDLLKRLDDSQDPVRILTCRLFVHMYEHQKCVVRQDAKGASDAAEAQLDGVHHETIVKGITIHFDDTNFDVQTAALDCLKCINQKQPGVVNDHIRSVHQLYRNSKALEQFL